MSRASALAVTLVGSVCLHLGCSSPDPKGPALPAAAAGPTAGSAASTGTAPSDTGDATAAEPEPEPRTPDASASEPEPSAKPPDVVEPGPAAPLYRPDEPPPRDEDCEPPYDQPTEGEPLPWVGFAYEGTTYSCNKCPAGHPLWEGSWRAVDSESEDPSVPLDGYTETFTISANTWHSTVTDSTDPDFDVATLDGWFWCPQEPEVSTEKTMVLEVLETAPGEALGFYAGEVFTADLLFSGSDKMLFVMDDAFYGESFADFLYCRLGAEIETLDGELVLCDLPEGAPMP